METAVKRFQSACSTLFKSTSIVLNQRSRIRFLDIQLEEIANTNFTGQHYTDSNWYRTPPLVPFVRCHNGFMDHPGPDVLVPRSPSISSHMKTCPELSLYEAISIIVFFRLPNYGLFLFIRHLLYLHGGSFIRTCGSYKIYIYNLWLTSRLKANILTKIS